jgi:hypothetical protein
MKGSRMRLRELGRAMASLIAVACIVALVFYGFRMFELRLETGNTFPEYSTYRADPKGLKVLYESLQGIHQIDVSRRLLQSRKPLTGENQVLLFAGVSPDALSVSEQDSDLFAHWLGTGGRLIFALRPEMIIEKGNEEEQQAGSRQKEAKFPISWRELVRNWGATIVPIEGTPPPRTLRSALFTKSIRWFGRNAFDHMSPEWKSVADIGGKTVITERAVGPGSLVLMGATYPLSNESLATDHETGLLVWLRGNRRGVVFDETHLGMIERASIMTLARRYGLEGALISTVVVLLLFFWRCQYSLIPKARPNRINLTITGSSSEQIFLNLLQHSVPQKDLIAVCIQTWLANRKPTDRQLAVIQTIGADQTVTAVEKYNRLTNLLNEKL